MIDYLDKPPQRYKHTFQKASGSREMVEHTEGKWVRFDDMDLYMFEGGQLMQQAATELDRLRAALRMIAGGFYPGHDVSLFAEQTLAMPASSDNSSVPP